MLAPEERLVGAQLERYIQNRLYWVLHAPRQTGKTTFLQSWMRELNATGEYAAFYVTIEACQAVEDPNVASSIIYQSIYYAAKIEGYQIATRDMLNPETLFADTLRNLAEVVAPKKLVILFDEVDCLSNEPMVRFLRLLRGGFATRGVGVFPISIALVGMLDLKDYLIQAKDGKAVNPGSPFNIKEDSATLSNFTKENVVQLFAQRTAETGQPITQDALNYVYEQSKGQPWIVNSLFKRATLRILDEKSVEPVTLNLVKQAREQMVLARETHLDALAYRLEDPQINGIIAKLMAGETDPTLVRGEAFRMCQDLGLVVIENGTPQVANPIYKEVLARQMTFGPQMAIAQPDWKWKKDDGTLDVDALLVEFQKFWRRHSEVWEQKSDYTEAFPHLLLMAFLQRVINGQGHIDREYAAGRGRMDLVLEYADKLYIIEIKLIYDYDTPQEVFEEGLKQIIGYRDKIGISTPSYLLIFDRRRKAKELSWDEKIWWKTDETSGIQILGC
jgi:hypothetical protein